MPNEISEDKVRLERLSYLRSVGINPYPSHTGARISISEALLQPETTAVKIAGRLVAKREMGKISFSHLKDASGKMQIAFSEKELGKDDYKLFTKYFDLGDFLYIDGELFITHKGELTVLVKKYELLAKALLPLPEKFHGLTDIETRYRQRYLDLIANSESMRIAKIRSVIVREIRNYFDSKGFFEVETPVLQTLYGGALAKPFVTHHNALDIPLYLRVAPELYLKRLIVGGFEKVYEIAKCFRNEGIDNNHNPEFTQIEFYWAYANYQDLMDLVEDLLPKIITAAGLPLKFKVQNNEVDFTPPYPRQTMRELIIQYANIDIEEFPDQESLFTQVKNLHIDGIDQHTGYGKMVDEIYKTYVRSKIINPIFMIDHPVELSPLAKKKPEDPRYVERMQLVCVGGNELCNAFSELNDPIDQEARFRDQERLGAAGDEESMPFDEDYVTALKHGMPPTAGLGMGIDRLIKLLVDTDNLKEVILFPTMRSVTSSASHHVFTDTPSPAKLSALPMTRDQALELLKKYNHKKVSFNHYLESEAVMRALAKRLGQDEDWWGMAGLLHDIDWELTSDEPKNHLTKAPQILKEAGFPDDFIQVILSHGYGCDCAGLQKECRTREIEFALAAGETVTGLIHASALLRPDKIALLTSDSVLKKFKSKGFAAKVNRDVIMECEKIGLPLKDFLELALEAIRAIAPEVDLA